MPLLQKIKRFLRLDGERQEATEKRMKAKEQELTHVMADKIEEEGVSKLKEAEQERDESKREKAQEMIRVAGTMRRGEADYIGVAVRVFGGGK